MARGPSATGGRVRTAVRSVLASRAELEASEERRSTERSGCCAVRELKDRRRAELFGVLRSVTLRPRNNVPALEAELFDGTGSVQVVWLGQRRIAGVEPGRRVRLEGLVSVRDGRPVIYNPRYSLVPKTGER
jgi:hypothetical protein